jgi:Tfp pilus assembly protein FimV
MSVATDVVPVVYIPPRARRLEREPALAPVIALLPPDERALAAPLRLTRRGVHVLVAAVAVLAGLLVVLAWASAPATAPASAAPPNVAVPSGDTLWSIAARIAPDRDPRAEISDLQRINHLASTDLVAGQLLRTH